MRPPMLQHLATQIAEQLGFPQLELAILITLKATVVGTVFLPAIGLLAFFAIWGERKVAGHIQGRLGPKHVGPFGLLQSMADGIKLVCKEDLIPGTADSIMFRVAPYVAFIPAFIALLAVPFGPQWVFEKGLNIGILYILAVLALEVISVIMAGWSSKSKWAVYGAMREACQMVSYEVPLGLSIVTAVLVAGSLNLVALSHMQAGGMQDWLAFHNPFLFIACIIFFISSLASVKRAPFDLPEAESELVGGFHTEYSGMRWAFFFFGEYAAMGIVGLIMAVLFLGGWNSPLGAYDPIYMLTGYAPTEVARGYFLGSLGTDMLNQSWTATSTQMGMGEGLMSLSPAVAAVLLNAYAAFWIVLKCVGVLLAHMWLRWTLPRMRIDQVMHACVKYLLPLSLVTLVGSACWVAFVPQATIAGVEIEGGALGPIYIAHAVGDTPIFQLIVQWLLALLGLGAMGWFGGIVAYAFLMRKKAVGKSFFPELMPVGKDATFQRGEKYVPDADRSLASE
jgi:NADH-quinone oxidoreductase subunit H